MPCFACLQWPSLFNSDVILCRKLDRTRLASESARTTGLPGPISCSLTIQWVQASAMWSPMPIFVSLFSPTSSRCLPGCQCSGTERVSPLDACCCWALVPTVCLTRVDSSKFLLTLPDSWQKQYTGATPCRTSSCSPDNTRKSVTYCPSAQSNDDISKDLMRFLSEWLFGHPEFKKAPMHIFSESYGGKMAIQWARDIDAANKAGKLEVNFR